MIRQGYRDLIEQYGKTRDSLPTMPVLLDSRSQRQQGFCGMAQAMNRCATRPYYVTEHGRLGRGPLDTKEGDCVCIFYSASTAFVLRPEDGSDVARLVGDAYLDGCVDLESMPSLGRGGDQLFRIR